MLTVAVLDPPPGLRGHHEAHREDGGPPISIGRVDSDADLWCGDTHWTSDLTGRLVSEGAAWWLVNPVSASALRFISDGGAVDAVVATGGAVVLPPMSGRIWIAGPEAGSGSVVLLVHRHGGSLPDGVRAILDDRPVARDTVPLRTQDDEVNVVLAAATWHRRHATGNRCLTNDEVGAYLGIDAEKVRTRLRAYRRVLERRDGFAFTGHHLNEELFNIVVDHRLITRVDDERLEAEFGSMPPLGALEPR